MNVPDFLCPRLVGKRFESHSIPLEMLGDLAVLEPMIIEVAKWQYLKENKNRKRSPRKFTDGISLTLTAVDEGSVIPKIALVLASSTNGLFSTPQQEYLELARDAVIGAISAVSEKKSPTDFIPQKTLAYFDRLGRSLLDGESIEFTTPTHSKPVRLTKESRLRLLNAAEIVERTEEIHLRGGIFDVNQEEMTFVMMLPSRSQIKGPISRQHIDAFLEASLNYRNGMKVLIDGVGKLNRANRLQNIESVEYVTLLDPLDFTSQVEELKTLKDGWYDGKGNAPPLDGLDWLVSTVNDWYSDVLPLPYLYPVAEGGVRLEWTLGTNEISLEIDLSKHTGHWHLLNIKTDDEEVKMFNLNLKEDWDWMSSRLQAIGGEGLE